MHSPASLGHEERIWFLDVLIGNFVAARRLGRVFGSNAVMQLGERRPCPDVSFLKAEHDDRIQGERVVGPVDLVVEVLSKSTRGYDLGEKRELYREGGVPEIWMFDVDRREAHTDMAEPGGYATRTLESGRIVSRVLDGLEIEASMPDKLSHTASALAAVTPFADCPSRYAMPAREHTSKHSTDGSILSHR